MDETTIRSPREQSPDRAPMWLLGVRALMTATLVLLVCSMQRRANFLPAANGIAAFAGVWVAIEGLERQWREAGRQRADLKRQVEAAEATARAAEATAKTTIARLRQERLDQLTRIEGMCSAVADSIQVVLNRPIRRGGWGAGAADPSPIPGASDDPSSIPLHVELHACAASLSAVLPVAGVLEPRHVREIAAGAVALEGFADRFARGAAGTHTTSHGVTESTTHDALTTVMLDLRRAAGAAQSARESLPQEKGIDA